MSAGCASRKRTAIMMMISSSGVIAPKAGKVKRRAEGCNCANSASAMVAMKTMARKGHCAFGVTLYGFMAWRGEVALACYIPGVPAPSRRMPQPTRLLLPLAISCLLAACVQPVRPDTPAVAPAQPPPVPTGSATATHYGGSNTTTAPTLSAEKRAAFVAEASKLSGMSAQEVNGWLDQARYQQSIINAITRPAEGKPWKDYRPIFMTADRINNGRSFFAEHRSELERISGETGVPPQYIVAIIGVETSYGRNTGSYRVLDALYTLGFFYPKREEFFRSELAQLFALARQQDLDLGTLKGSYA